MGAIGLSILACLGWGIADFIGGFKSRHLPTLSILMISTLMGTLVLGAIIAMLNRPLPQDPQLLWAVGAGLVGIGAMYLLYRSLSLGSMAILAPISATGVILPVIFGIAIGEEISALKLSGILIAISGTLMAAMEKDRIKNQKRLTKGIGLAAGSALFVGFYFISMDLAAAHDPVWASMIMRISTLIFLIPILLMTKTKVRVKFCHLPAILIMGALDTLAAFCFALATFQGLLSQVSVISSLYPAVTVLISCVIIGEKIRKIQFAGILFAMTGVMLISVT